MANKINLFSYFNPNFDMDDIKIIYMPQKETDPLPSIHEYHYHIDISDEAQKSINETWAQECALKPLQNEVIPSVRFLNLENGNLDIMRADYKVWKTTAKKEFFAKFGNSIIPNPLNVQALIQTNDEQLILGPRPDKGVLQLPGGMINVNTDLENNQISLKKGAVREFQEEIALLPVHDIRFLGTSFYAGRVLSTAFLSGKIDMSAEQLQVWRAENTTQIKDYDDFPTIEFVKTTAPDIETTIQTKKMMETALIALLLLGAQKFGRLWFYRTCPPQMLAPHLQIAHTRV